MTLAEAKKIIKSECYIADLLDLDRTQMVNTALDTVIEAAEVTRWIPVSERLPEKEGRYLCTVGSNYRNPREMYYAPQEWAKESDNATWRSTDGSYVYDWFVEAWMPLPEPYMAESEDKECNSMVEKSEE